MRLVALALPGDDRFRSAVAAPVGAHRPAACARRLQPGRFDAAIGAARTALDDAGRRGRRPARARPRAARALSRARGRARPGGGPRRAARRRPRASHAGRSWSSWLLGLGQWLFFTERFGAAAELFEERSSRPLAGGDLASDRCSTGGPPRSIATRRTSTGDARPYLCPRVRSDGRRSCGATRDRSRPTTGWWRQRARWATSTARGRPRWPPGCRPPRWPDRARGAPGRSRPARADRDHSRARARDGRGARHDSGRPPTRWSPTGSDFKRSGTRPNTTAEREQSHD